jgi:plastocyanin
MPSFPLIRRALALSAAVALTAVAAGADTVPADPVLQIHQEFDPKAISVTAGATVQFSNADDVNHNLQTIAPDGARKDYGVEKPGESTPISFPAAGVYQIVCSIHPRMKMKVTVQ